MLSKVTHARGTPYMLDSERHVHLPSRKPSQFQATVAALITIVIAGCIGGTAPLPAPYEESPLVQRIDARVGTFYTGNARIARGITPVVRFEFGKTSVRWFGQAFDAMFSETVALPDWPPWREGVMNLDGVVELDQARLDVSLGDDRARPDTIAVSYRVCLYDIVGNAVGSVVKCWTATADHSYQRSLFECLNLRTCLQRQVEVMMREAIARFIIQFNSDPVVEEWQARVSAAK